MMINPGGIPQRLFNKSSVSRFNNNQAAAQRATMPHNEAAQQAVRNKYSASNPGGPAVGPQQSQANVLPPLSGPSPGDPVEIPTGGGDVPLDEGFDPEVFRQNMLDEVVGRIRTQQFLNSPRVKDAVTSVRLKNFFNSSNPNRVPDSRDLFTQVLHRMKMGLQDD